MPEPFTNNKEITHAVFLFNDDGQPILRRYDRSTHINKCFYEMKSVWIWRLGVYSRYGCTRFRVQPLFMSIARLL